MTKGEAQHRRWTFYEVVKNECINNTSHQEKNGAMKIYVGDLSYNTTEEDLQQAFLAFGQIASVSIIKDKFSGQSKRFGFVEMPAKDETEAAISSMNGKEMKGRTLNVNEARPRPEEHRWSAGSKRSGYRPRY